MIYTIETKTNIYNYPAATGFYMLIDTRINNIKIKHMGGSNTLEVTVTQKQLDLVKAQLKGGSTNIYIDLS